MPRVVHFEIHAGEPERLVAFYGDLFGWQFQKWEGPMDYWLITTGTGQPGIDGGLVRRMGEAPAVGQAVNAYVCTVDVDDLDAVLARAGKLGSAVALPRMAVPGIGWLAYIRDPDENLLGLMQSDPTAA
ncbi:MAG: VOC family protein [Gemmatimonadota bacterium]|nr:VOC family protein [Gemmatimonadota bacterium]